MDEHYRGAPEDSGREVLVAMADGVGTDRLERVSDLPTVSLDYDLHTSVVLRPDYHQIRITTVHLRTEVCHVPNKGYYTIDKL